MFKLFTTGTAAFTAAYKAARERFMADYATEAPAAKSTPADLVAAIEASDASHWRKEVEADLAALTTVRNDLVALFPKAPLAIQIRMDELLAEVNRTFNEVLTVRYHGVYDSAKFGEAPTYVYVDWAVLASEVISFKQEIRDANRWSLAEKVRSARAALRGYGKPAVIHNERPVNPSLADDLDDSTTPVAEQPQPAARRAPGRHRASNPNRNADSVLLANLLSDLLSHA